MLPCGNIDDVYFKLWISSEQQLMHTQKVVVNPSASTNWWTLCKVSDFLVWQPNCRQAQHAVSGGVKLLFVC